MGNRCPACPDRSLTLSVPETASLLGINRNTAYELAARGDLPTVRLGKRVLVVRTRLERMLEGSLGQVELFPEYPVHGHRSLGLDRRHDMAVGVHREADLAVAESLHHDSWRDALGK